MNPQTEQDKKAMSNLYLQITINVETFKEDFKKHLEIIEELLVSNKNIIDTKIYGATPLCIAVKYKNIAVCELLIKCGAGINMQGDGYGTALSTSVYNRASLEIFNFLLEKGADINIVSKEGVTPLIALLISIYDKEKENTEIAETMMRILIQRGTNLTQITNEKFEEGEKSAFDIINSDRYTDTSKHNDTRLRKVFISEVIHKLCNDNNIEHLRLILKNNWLDPNSKDEEEVPFITYAIEKGRKDIALELIKAGAKVILPTRKELVQEGRITDSQQEEKFYEQRKKLDDDTNKLLCSALHNDELSELVEKLFDPYKEITKKSLTSQIIHLVCNKNMINIAKEIQEKKWIDPNSTDKNNISFLRYAVEKNRIQIAIRLIDAGADISEVNPQDGYTLLHIAVIKGYSELAEVLREKAKEKNIDIENIYDKDNKRAKDYEEWLITWIFKKLVYSIIFIFTVGQVNWFSKKNEEEEPLISLNSTTSTYSSVERTSMGSLDQSPRQGVPDRGEHEEKQPVPVPTVQRGQVGGFGVR